MPDRRQVLAGLASMGALAAASVARAATGLTEEVGDFIAGARFQDLPLELVELGRKHILDSLGLALAGGKAESALIVRRYLAATARPGPCSVLGARLKLAPAQAAFANGVAIHADDYDDTQLALAKDRAYGLLTHPSVTALPPALALAEAHGLSGRDFLAAYHLGVEVECKLAEASDPRAYETGFHSTGLFGVFGAASAAAKARGLPAHGVRMALGVAGASASGLRENFGTMTKPFQAGHAAECGVEAAELVALGWTAADNILEAGNGFYHAVAGGYDGAAVSGRLGKPWSLLTPGVSIKPYPSGSLTHPAMDEMGRLAKANGLKPEAIEQIRVGGNREMLNTLIRHRPTTGLEGKFSMEYCMAVMVLDGGAGLGQFTDRAVRRPQAQDLLKRVDFYNKPESDQAGADKMRSFIEIRLKDGRVIEGQPVDYARGSPQLPMSFDDVQAKFRDCAGYAGLSAARARQVIEAVKRLETLPRAGALALLLATDAR